MESFNPGYVKQLISSDPNQAFALIESLYGEVDGLRHQLSEVLLRYEEAFSGIATTMSSLNEVAAGSATKADLKNLISGLAENLRQFLNGNLDAIGVMLADNSQKLLEELRKYRRSHKGRRVNHNDDLAESRKIRARERKIIREFIDQRKDQISSAYTLKNAIHDCWTLASNQKMFDGWAHEKIAGTTGANGEHKTVGYPNYEAAYAYFAGHKFYKGYLRPGPRLKRYG